MSWRIEEEVDMFGQQTGIQVLREEDDEPCKYWFIVMWKG